MKLFCFSLFTISIFCCQAQEWVWAKKADQTYGPQKAIMIQVDTLGNVYMLAHTDTFCVYGGKKISKGCFLVKYSNQGMVIWARNLLFEANFLQVSQDLNLYIASNYSSVVSSDTHNYTSAGATDILVVKMTPDGSEIWSQTYGGPGQDIVHDMCDDGKGALFITGSTSGDTVHFNNYFKVGEERQGDFFIAKILDQGTLKWLSYGNQDADIPYMCGYEIAIDCKGVVYVAGSTLNVHSQSAFVTKYSSEGQLIFEFMRSYHYFGYETNSLFVDDSLNIFLIQGPRGPHSGSPGLCIYDSLMQIRWCEGGSGQYQCAYSGIPTCNNKGEIFFAGTLYENPEYSCGIVNDSIHISRSLSYPAKGGADIFLTKRNSQGKQIWNMFEGTSGNEYPTCSTTDKHGNFYLAGLYNQSMALGKNILLNDWNYHQIFLAKLSRDKTIVEQPNTRKECIFDVFPNPVDGILTVTNCNINSITVYNPLGQLIYYEKNLTGPEINIDVSYLPQGLIYLLIDSDGQLYHRSIVVK